MPITKRPILFLSITLFVITAICNYSNAQNNAGFSAETYLKYGDYNRALIEYLKLYSSQKSDINLNTKVGFCYLHVNDDKTKAIPFLEFAYKKGGYEDDLLLYLGRAYMYDYKFDKAINYFNDYKGKAKVKIKGQEKANYYIKNCESAQRLVKNPKNVTFKNLGKNINSKFADYAPFVTRDQGTLYFTSSRISNKEPNLSSQDLYTSDIYFSKRKDGEWPKAKDVGNIINTAEDEKCVYVTPDGKSMIIYIDNELVVGDLFITNSLPKGRFSIPTPFDNPVNTVVEFELEGCIFNDMNTIIISSKRSEGYGETDLYMFKKLPNNEWGMPINLGPNVNTHFKESFPRFDETNNILYFSSEGHDNMGGFDIFQSQFNTATQTFEKAVNMGYPINTPEDNMQFSLAGNKRDGYISAYRKEGVGDLDIYHLIFNDVEINVSVIKGIVTVSDSANKNISALVTIFNKVTNQKVETKNSSAKTGKYVFAVEPGKYLLTVSSPSFQEYSQEIVVYDKSESDYVFETERNVVLQTFEAITTPTETLPLKPKKGIRK